MAYPERVSRKKSKSSEKKSGGRHKVWLSECSIFQAGRDISPRLSFPWWKSPMMKQERLKKAATRKKK